MPPDDFKNQNSDIAVRIELLRLLESGLLDLLECPQCHKNSVSVRFTHPRINEYRTWFVCDHCSFSMRVQNSERPQHFLSERVDEQLEEYDSDVLLKKRLKGSDDSSSK
jgi:transcription elongation factor Elf1